MDSVFHYLSGLLFEIWHLLAEMAPFLLFGFLIAGILHVLLPDRMITRHLSGNRFSSVVKATIFGIPLPLCSCGVIPVSAHLQKQGAGRGPILSFLVSTPTTGVDSILATYSLLGPLLAVARPIAALINGLLVGLSANLLKERPVREPDALSGAGDTAENCRVPPASPGDNRIKQALNYAFFDLVADVARWLIIGIVLGGIISFVVPTAWVETYLGSSWTAYPLMLLIGIPMYICATGSIPIAAALILKGMSPGAGFILLFAGPATNAATLAFVGGKLGRGALAVYLLTILVCGLAFGSAIDGLWQYFGRDADLVGGGTEMLPEMLKIISAVVLLALIVRPYLSRRRRRRSRRSSGLPVQTVRVPGMSCEHCKRTIDTALRKLEGVREVDINLDQRRVAVQGRVTPAQVAATINGAGYEISTGNDGYHN